MTENIISNPFVGCTARDMNFSEIRQYWCSPFALYKLSESELFTSRTPIVIEGVRGTGKTMILKYLSYFVQRDIASSIPDTPILEYLKERCIGVYFRYKDDFCNMFDELDCSDTEKERIFIHYYELFIVRQIIEILTDIYKDQEDEPAIANILCAHFHIPSRPLHQIRVYINSLLREMDNCINSYGYDVTWKDRILSLTGSGNMVRELIQTINSLIDGWDHMLFVILLDEYENLGKFQTVVNTLLKQVDDTVNLTYRLGMRPAGMDHNNQTNVAHEHLQIDRDFLLRRLEYSNFTEYKKFALEISKRRLESIELYRENDLLDINLILGKSENFDEEAAAVAKSSKQFRLIKKFYSAENMKDVKQELSCDNKLLEMYNILLVLRGKNYKKVGALCRQYLHQSAEQKNNKEEMDKYRSNYVNKYRMTLLYMLLTIYGERKLYYSVNTFLYLSSGSINDFISLCRNVFKQINMEIIEQLKHGKTVSAQIQTYAALDTAEDQKRKVSMSNKYGREMYTFIDNMGSIFEEYHRDLGAKYPETNQFAFDDENQIKNHNMLDEYLVELINSGAVIRKSKRQLISVGKPRGYIYQLNRIYAPIYQYSYRTRGGYNQIITIDDFESMLKQTIDPHKYVGIHSDLEQYELFDSVEDGADE